MQAQEAGHDMTQMMATGLMMPSLDAARGRALFASKGCVVCHSVNGIAGVDAPEVSAEFMAPVRHPFEFAARMWRGAGTMVMMEMTTEAVVRRLSTGCRTHCRELRSPSQSFLPTLSGSRF